MWQAPAAVERFQVTVVEQVYPQCVPSTLRARCAGDYARETPWIRMHGYDAHGTPVSVWTFGFEPYLWVETGDLPPSEAGTLARAIESMASSERRVRVQQVDVCADGRYRSLEHAEQVRVARVSVQEPKQVAAVRSMWFLGTAEQRLGRAVGRRVWEANVKFHERFMIDHELVPYCWVPLPAEHTVELLDDDDRDMLAPSVRAFVLAHQYVRGLPCEGDNARNAPMPLLACDIECVAPTGEFPNPQNCEVIMVAALIYRDATASDRESNVFDRRIFVTGGEVAPWPDDHATPTQVQLCADERALLLAFAQLWHERQPAFTTDHNGDNFDWPVMRGRALELGIEEEFCALIGRDRRAPLTLKQSSFSSNARGDEKDFNLTICGSTKLDTLRWTRNTHKLRSYRLDDVVKELVAADAGKVPIHHSQIPVLYRGSAEQRRLLSEYCVLDAELAAKIVLRQKVITNYIEMSRITGVDVHGLITSGQQTKVHNQLLRHCRRVQMLVPTRPDTERQALLAALTNAQEQDDDDDCALGRPVQPTRAAPFVVKRTAAPPKRKAQKRAALYEGATVIEPRRGYYTRPITTLDFSSLYPSIMCRHNLCYSTLVRVGERCEHQHDASSSDEVLECCVEQTPNNYRFWRQHVREGILPRLLVNLLAARGVAKRRMADANKEYEQATQELAALEERMRVEDGVAPTSCDGERSALAQQRAELVWKMEGARSRRDIYDGAQLALKVSANSVYGFTGATIGMLPCLAISSSVTAYGRQMIEYIQRLVERKYRGAEVVAALPEMSAQVVYGDSVAPDTPLFVKDPEGKMILCAACELPVFLGGEFAPWHETKEALEAPPGWMTWSSCGWTPLERLIRHRVARGTRLIRVSTATGVVDVTVDHSLLRDDATVVTPREVRFGERLLHRRRSDAMTHSNALPPASAVREAEELGQVFAEYDTVPAKVLNASSCVIWSAFLRGIDPEWPGVHSDYYCSSQTLAAGVATLYEFLGHTVRVRACADNRFSLRVVAACEQSDRLEGLVTLPPLGEDDCLDDCVYDLQTGNHHFAAGVGNLVVHNTDSIMVNFGVEHVADAMAAGRHAADMINAAFALQAARPAELAQFRAEHNIGADESLDDALLRDTELLGAAARARFRSAISIVFEKVLWPYLLINKKRYAGGFYTRNPAEPDKVHQSGIESVRRDNALFTARTVGAAVSMLMRERDAVRMLAWLRREVRGLARGLVPLEQLVISAGLNKDAAKYVNPDKMAHLVVNKKMREREAGSEYHLGERVPYVIVETGDRRVGGKVRKAPSAEHPDYAREHKLPLCIDYYVESQIRKPLRRILDTIWGEGAADALLFTPDVLQQRSTGVQHSFGGVLVRAAASSSSSSSSSSSMAQSVAELPLETPDAVARLVDAHQRRRRAQALTPLGSLFARIPAK